jgi:hypothetical protein
MRLVALGGVVALGGGAASGIAARVPAAATLVRSVDTGTVRDASDASTAVATSVSFTVDLHAQIPPHHAVHLVVRGQMNFVHHTVTATVTLPRATLPASASDAEALSQGNSLTVQTEWVNQHAYMSVPAAWAALAGGARILSLPTSSSLRRIVTTMLTQSAVALTYAKLLLDELTEDHTAHRAVTRSIGGVPATGTQVELTLADLLKLVPELSPTMTKDVARMADQTIPATVWVDHQGRLVEVDLADPQGSPASVRGTVRFSDYGAPAPAAVPPATTVQPIPPALLQLLGGWYYF